MDRALTIKCKRLILTCTAAILLVGTAAFADNIDFSCSLNQNSHCTGTVSQSGSNYSATDISVYNDSGPYSKTVPFTLAFNTLTSTISIDGTGQYLGQDLEGQITSFNVTQGQSTIDLSVIATWPTLPPDVQTFLGSSTGIDSGFVIMTMQGSAQSTDMLITPTPEPSPLGLFSAGLLVMGAVLCRKLRQSKV
jgi:hypothetical protein